MGVAAGTDAHVLSGQIVLGLITGLVTLPIAVYFFQRKWTRIIACSAVGSTYAVVLILVAGIQHPIDARMLASAIGLVLFAWSLCGFLAGWVTFVLSDYVEQYLLKNGRRAASAK
jgi:hypothetical protein